MRPPAEKQAAVPENWLQGEALHTSRAYWKKQLGENPPALELPTDRARPAVPTYRRESQRFALSPIAREGLLRLCGEEAATLFEGLFAAYQILLQRYSGQNDLVTAATIANTLPLRVDLSGNPTFRELLNRVRGILHAARAHAALPLAQLAHELYPQRDPSRLFQSAFAFKNGVTDYTGADGTPANDELAKFEVDFAIVDGPQGCEGVITYNADLFDAATITRMAGHYQALLHGAVANPDTRIALLQILPDEEWQQIVRKWNATEAPFPSDACLHHLFEAQAESLPDKIAVVFADAQLTYGELNRRANKLAHYLQKLGVGPDTLVGVYMNRSLEMVIGLYGILKAGGAYVPLDPSYPASRLAFMLEDTQVQVLLTETSLRANLNFATANFKLICLDQIAETIAPESAVNPHSSVTPAHLAYVIYTSGSTGRPKGAVLNHRGRVSNFCDFNRRYAIGANDRLLGLASLSFDMSAYDIFGTLLTGGTIVIVAAPAILEPGRWAELMVHHDITVWHSVPALLEMLVNHCSDHPGLTPRLLRLALLGGDWIPVSLPDRLKSLIPGVHVVSMGGATEVSMDSTIYDIVDASSAWKSIPYGVPMANQLAYVLDKYLQPVPVGVPCELHLGGIGVGRGYWNRPELTAEKFIPNPFSGIAGDRMYKTGDLARHPAVRDGNLELLGRMDFQVKIRGYRIELGEIISALAKHPAVKEAVVVAKDEKPDQVGSGKRLVAYIVPDSKYGQAAHELVPAWREYLHKCLPEYMVPTAFVLLEALPLSPNGKIDRRALPAPDFSRPELSTAFVAPRHPVEEVVAQIWSDVFAFAPIGVQDNFLELGGHSLMATKIMAQLRDIFPVILPVHEFWEAPTVAQFATRLIAAGQAEEIDIVEIARTLMQINQLSDEQIEAMLAEKAALAGIVT
ncbi:MAG: Linear gramicidin synthase subunit D [bacterium]|nr:Linear gramicidin synthase subunit D [bacterium]